MKIGSTREEMIGSSFAHYKIKQKFKPLHELSQLVDALEVASSH